MPPERSFFTRAIRRLNHRIKLQNNTGCESREFKRTGTVYYLAMCKANGNTTPGNIHNIRLTAMIKKITPIQHD